MTPGSSPEPLATAPWPETPREGIAPRGVRLGFLISERAGTVIAVRDAIERGDLPGCSIALVACNVTGAPGVEAARSAGLRTVTLEGRGREQRDHEDTLHALLGKMGVDLVCLSGYLRVLSREFVRRWPLRILSVHGSLLPAFPGPRPERQALDFGAQITGCTVSLLDNAAEPGGGVVVVQRPLAIRDEETEGSLKARLVPEAHDAYIEAIRRVSGGEFVPQGRRYLPQTCVGTLAPEPATPRAEEILGASSTLDSRRVLRPAISSTDGFSSSVGYGRETRFPTPLPFSLVDLRGPGGTSATSGVPASGTEETQATESGRGR